MLGWLLLRGLLRRPSAPGRAWASCCLHEPGFFQHHGPLALQTRWTRRAGTRAGLMWRLQGSLTVAPSALQTRCTRRACTARSRTRPRWACQCTSWRTACPARRTTSGAPSGSTAAWRRWGLGFVLGFLTGVRVFLRVSDTDFESHAWPRSARSVDVLSEDSQRLPSAEPQGRVRRPKPGVLWRAIGEALGGAEVSRVTGLQPWLLRRGSMQRPGGRAK